MGLGLGVFGVYVLLLGVGKYFLFQKKAGKFFSANHLDWDYVIAQKVNEKQFLLPFFLPSFTQVKGFQNQRQATSLSRCYPKSSSEGAGQDFGRTFIFVLICEMEIFLPSVFVSSSYLCWR